MRMERRRTFEDGGAWKDAKALSRRNGRAGSSKMREGEKRSSERRCGWGEWLVSQDESVGREVPCSSTEVRISR